MQLQQLGPYRLGKKLGQGGMGAVYEGVEIESGQAAAIKILSPALLGDEGFRARFEAEIESLKKLRHPNIVRLYGYGAQGEILFYAMELVNGTSLEDELRAGRRFEWREVTQIAIKLCRALKHAHDHGVIHRDLKPANLLVSSDGEIKLSDFGIARLFGNTRMTSDGGVLGTAEYMAPEQADGRSVTDRCDQYSLGSVMYALLAGRPPFRAKSLLEMLQLQRFADPEPVTRFAPQIPAELARIIHQLLEKEPQKRFANALMLARSLEAMERGLSVSLSRDDDFVLSEVDVPPAEDAPGGPLPLTLTPTQLGKLEHAQQFASIDLNVTAATLAYGQQAPERQDVATVDRFTKVEDQHESRSGGLAELLSSLLSPQTLALGLSLLLLAGAAWYLMRPPSADSLYRQIEAATADGELASLRAVQPRIDRFLELYPDDPRSENLRSLKDEASQANPVQRLYNEAMRYALINPELAIVKLQALIDVYGDGDETPDSARHYVRLSRQQHARLEKRVSSYVTDGQNLVASRLARAAKLAPNDPAAAGKIYQGIVELYDDKPWAAALVSQARAALNQTSQPQAAAEQP